jgi:hypothetical protein
MSKKKARGITAAGLRALAASDAATVSYAPRWTGNM